MTPDINVCLVNFPCSGEEMVIPNEDTSYTILINSRLSHENQVKAYYHAIKHLQNNDFEKNDVQQIEAEAHQGGYIF